MLQSCCTSVPAQQVGSRLAWQRGDRSDVPSVPSLSACPVVSPQSCLSRQQLLAAIRQMQQLLKGQETRFAEGLRVMRSRLSTLHSSLAKAAPEPPPGESLLCPLSHFCGPGGCWGGVSGCSGLWRVEIWASPWMEVPVPALVIRACDFEQI